MDNLVAHFEHARFIAADPISIPHGFDDPRDQEVIGLFSALLAWGRRETVLRNMEDLCERMDYRPFRFVWDFRPDRDAAVLDGFRHRTFQPEDAQWMVNNLHVRIRDHGSVEQLFARGHRRATSQPLGEAIEFFSESILTASPETPRRLRKHLARPSTGSACKRLCMFVRWMVREGPFDLGAWSAIPAAHLVLPLDVHSGRQARRLGLLQRRTNDWRSAMELTRACQALCPTDPAKYDLALFGVGAYDVELDPRFTVDPTEP